MKYVNPMIKLFPAGAFLISLLGITSNVSAETWPPYQDLLDNCGDRIQAIYPDSKMVLEKKVQPGGKHKFWISVTTKDNEAAKAYCEGMTVSGEIHEFAVANEAWNKRHMVSDARILLESRIANN